MPGVVIGNVGHLLPFAAGLVRVVVDGVHFHGFISNLGDKWIKYRHIASTPLGTKRNDLVSAARGEVIVHFDVDDYYAPSYIERMLEEMARANVGLIKLSGCCTYDQRAKEVFYWGTHETPLTQYVCKPGFAPDTLIVSADIQSNSTRHLLGFGSSYVYKRSIAIRYAVSSY